MSSQEEQERPQRIVVGVDGSEESRAALRWAVDEAELRGAELEAVMAWQLPALEFVGPTAGYAVPATAVMDREVFARRAEETLEQSLQEVIGDKPIPAMTRS